MTRPECKTLITDTILAIWPKWEQNPTRNTMVFDMFASWELPDVQAAIRQANVEAKPGVFPIDVLKAAQAILRGKARVEQATAHPSNWLEQRLEEHRQHYAGNRASGLEWPGDEAVREMIRRGEATPMQRYTMRRMAEGRKKLER
jgi:hypothetical protein